MLKLFKQCARNVLQGQVLTYEDVVDVLTLKDKPSDFFTALQLVKRMRVCSMQFIPNAHVKMRKLECPRSTSGIRNASGLAENIQS